MESDDEEFLMDMYRHAPTVVNAAPYLLVPRDKESCARYYTYVKGCMLGVVICLLPGTEDTTANEVATQPTPIGVIHLNSEEARLQHHRRSELGLKIIPQYQRKGYGTEAILWALRWGFQQANLHRIGLTVYAYNERAFELYKCLGFVSEGRKRQSIWIDGRYWDEHILSMLEGEWRKRYGQKDLPL